MLPLVANAEMPLGGVVKVDAGRNHACAILQGGRVKCWGENNYGQLGDGSTTVRWAPVDVVGLEAGVVGIAAGEGHTCAVLAAGGVKCWGDNFDGQLGDGTRTQRTTPVNVVGLESGAVAIAAGHFSTCAVTTAGGAKCWGSNYYGILGDGTTTRRLAPVDVVGLGSGVAELAGGGVHTCALTIDGAMKCWGANGAGALGDGTLTDRLTPVDVVGLGGIATSIVVGSSFTCAIVEAGEMKCWGANGSGQLGDGTTISRPTPGAVAITGGDVSSMAAGFAHACAITSDGIAMCWGENLRGQLGDNSFDDHLTPAMVIGIGAGAAAITAGNEHTCALTSAGRVSCWGMNTAGQLGDNSEGRRVAPVGVIGLGSGATAISAGAGYSCAISVAGRLLCWGWNGMGNLGNGTFAARLLPTEVQGQATGTGAIVAGEQHTCALTNAGAAKCWGYNSYGQLGNGTGSGVSNVPTDVVGLSSGTAAIAVGRMHTCALTLLGGVKCWGYNDFGPLGVGGVGSSNVPVDVMGLSAGVTAIATGRDHSCALTTNGNMKCWGYNNRGQLGVGDYDVRTTPADVQGLENVISIAAGAYHTCAIISGGSAMCWGSNSEGQLGDGTRDSHMLPTPVEGLGAGLIGIAAGQEHTCAVTSDGGAKCWGRNDLGQLGDNSTQRRLTPTDVTGLANGVVAISAGGLHTCARDSAGSAKCWGTLGIGQLGDGSALIRPLPGEVLLSDSGFANGFEPSAPQ